MVLPGVTASCSEISVAFVWASCKLSLANKVAGDEHKYMIIMDKIFFLNILLMCELVIYERVVIIFVTNDKKVSLNCHTVI